MKLINGHLNTVYSFFNSTISIDDLFKTLEKNQISFFSVTEINNFFSYGPILAKTFNSNFKPIFGLELDAKIADKKYRYILYPKSKEGLKSLFLLSNLAINNSDITLADLLVIKDIAIVEHPLLGFYALTKQKNFFNNYFYSFQFFDLEANEDFIIENLNKTLIINCNQILDIADNAIIEVLHSLNNEKNNTYLYNLNFEFEVKNKLEEKLINQTNEFLKSSYFEINEVKYVIPEFKNSENMSSFDYLKFLIMKNIPKKFKKAEWTNEYIERLNFEFDIIQKLKFENYFLIIQDWVNWAKNNNIAIGPGRGSAAGSLICYLLNITEIDPLKYDLIFERFLNPSRVSMPDIDIDVQDDRRQEILDYIQQKYGKEYVANIVTFSTLGKKSAIRDVLRIHNVNSSTINNISKAISMSELSLQEEYEHNKIFRNAIDVLDNFEPYLAMKVVSETAKLEGLYRQTGTHAAGIIIGLEKLNTLIPTYDLSGYQQSQISMEYLEKFGLIKMDILGLKTLTTIKQIVNEINEHGNKFELKDIDYNDKKTFDLMSSGNTAGVFQLEGFGMINAIKKVKISNFDDIVAIISLFRPGPMENLDVYAKRKFGKEEMPKIHPKYDEILKPTYGVIVYQEQIMQIVQAIANMSFAEADNIRRIISKKKHDELPKIKKEFLANALSNNVSSTDALKIYNNIEKFADYGFNKSHAVAYATLAYQLAYLKTHYPLEFYNSVISSAHGSHTTISKYVAEARSNNIDILSPDINISDINSVIYNNKIYLPLIMIKGLGPETAKEIIENRKKYGPYKNFEHFYLASSYINQFGNSTLSLLIKASALRQFGYNQATLLNEIENNSDLKILANFFKNNPNKISEKEILNYEPDKILETDFLTQTDNEVELLGSPYNFSITSKYEKDGMRLNDLRNNVEYLIYVYCNKVTRRMTKFNKPYYSIDFQDSSKKIIVQAYNELKDKNWMDMSKSIVKIKLIKKEDRYLLLDWWKI